jgi:cyclohexanecarboxyl-CoA dehydrogenase
VAFQDVPISSDARIGGEGQAASLFVRHFTYWRVLMAAAALGSCETVIDQTVERLKTRMSFGGPIGRFTHLQQELATCLTQVHLLRLLIQNTTARINSRLPAVADAAMCKAEAVETAIQVVNFGMRVHGASGYEKSTKLEKRLRDLLGLRIADGTTDVLRGQVAQSVLGNELYNLALGRTQKKDWSSIQSRRYW